jgi:hypothetical protein
MSSSTTATRTEILVDVESSPSSIASMASMASMASTDKMAEYSAIPGDRIIGVAGKRKTTKMPLGLLSLSSLSFGLWTV